MTRLTALRFLVGIATIGVAPAHTRITETPARSHTANVPAQPNAFAPDMVFELEPLVEPEGERAALVLPFDETADAIDDEPAEAFQPRVKSKRSRKPAPATKKKAPERTKPVRMQQGGESAVARPDSGMMIVRRGSNGLSYMMNRKTGAMIVMLETWKWEGFPGTYTSSDAAWKNQPASCSGRNRASVCASLKHQQTVVGDSIPDDIRKAKVQWASETHAHKIK